MDRRVALRWAGWTNSKPLHCHVAQPAELAVFHPAFFSLDVA